MRTNCYRQFVRLFLSHGLPLLFYTLPLWAIAQSNLTLTKAGTNYRNDLSGGTISYSNPEKAALADAQRATATTTLTLLGTAKTAYLVVTDFGFSIPDAATVSSVSIKVRKRSTGTVTINNYVMDASARLVVNGTITGANMATTTHWPGTDAEETYTYNSNMAGTALTPAIINNANFGFAFSAAYTGLAGVKQTAEIDQVQMTVAYTPTTLPVKLYTFFAAVQHNTVALQWTMAEQEKGAAVTVERSMNGTLYSPIYDMALQSATSMQTYGYEDQPSGNSDQYYYRLKLVAADGKITYSPVRKIAWTIPATITIYPNPTTDYISIDTKSITRDVLVLNQLLQPAPVQAFTNNDEKIKLNVSHLTTGIYYVKWGDQLLRFIKQ